MEGLIINFRGGVHTHYNNQMIIKVPGIDTKEKAEKLLRKKVIWKTSSGKEITGEITKTHGNKGCLRIRFEKGLPGQAIGTKIKIE